ncbi:MAG: carboxypeptidase-like regulatory domain-containing protein, partial [Chitinophagaceae bacterium]
MKGHLIFTAILQGFNLLMINDAFGQETNGNISGIILSDSGKPVQGASILLTNEPTQRQYHTISAENGRYHFNLLKPGGPYTLEVSHILHQQAKKNN